MASADQQYVRGTHCQLLTVANGWLLYSMVCILPLPRHEHLHSLTSDSPATSIGAICVLFVYISKFLSQVSVVRSALQKLMTNHIRGTLLDACLQFSPEWMQLPWEWALDRGL